MLTPRFANDGSPTLKLNSVQLKAKAEIEQKVTDNKYKFEKLQCSICSSDDFESIADKDRYGLYFIVVVCRKCGLVQTNPRMTKSSYDEFYNAEYRRLYVGTEEPKEAFFKSQMYKGKLIYQYLESNGVIRTDKEQYVLEIGCGAGGILEYFREKGCKVKGVDLGEEYINYGRDVHKLDLSAGSLFDVKLEKQPDIVIYSHIMEHVLEPSKELKALYSSLSDDSVLYIEVPGIKNLKHNYNYDLLKYLQNAHVSHFSLKTLNNLLGINGFKMIKGDEYIRSISRKDKIDTYFAIENDYNDVVSYLKDIEKKRKINQIISLPANTMKSLIIKAKKMLRS